MLTDLLTEAALGSCAKIGSVLMDRTELSALLRSSPYYTYQPLQAFHPNVIDYNKVILSFPIKDVVMLARYCWKKRSSNHCTAQCCVFLVLPPGCGV